MFCRMKNRPAWNLDFPKSCIVEVLNAFELRPLVGAHVLALLLRGWGSFLRFLGFGGVKHKKINRFDHRHV